MEIGNSPLDRKLIVLEAYITPFENIEKAKERYGPEINARITDIEEIITTENSLQINAIIALKNNDDQKYDDSMLQIKKQYDGKQVESLQSGIIKVIQTALKENITPKEKPAESIIPVKAQQPREQAKIINQDISRKEYYTALIQKYDGKMYNIRQKIIGEKGEDKKPLPPATEEEIDAWFAWFVQDLIFLKKRKGSSEIMQEERNFLKEQISKWGKRKVFSVYYAELKELGIWKDI